MYIIRQCGALAHDSRSRRMLISDISEWNEVRSTQKKVSLLLIHRKTKKKFILMLIYLFALFSSHTRLKLILISSPRSSCWCCAEIYRAEMYKMIFGNSLGSLSHFCSHVRKNSPIHLLSASPNLPIHVIRESVGIACSVLVGVLPKKTTLKEEEKLQWENREEQQQQLTKTSTPGHRQCRLLLCRSEVREEEKNA